MMKRTGPVLLLRPAVLLCLLFLASNVSPHQCQSGSMKKNSKCVPCNNEEYWYRRSGVGLCEKCTSRCSAEDYMVEKTACTKWTKRVCYCKPGFFCPKPTEITCRVPCEPCEKGTFSNKISLERTCQRHSECASPEMLVIAEGSPTQDRVCAYPTTTSNPATTTIHMTTSIPTTTFISTTTSTPMATSIPTTISIPKSSSTPLTAPSATIPTSTAPEAASIVTPVRPVTSHSKPITLLQQQTTSHSSEGTVPHRTTRQASSLETNRSIQTLHAEGSPLSSHSPSWMLLLLLAVFLLLVVTCLSMKCKGKVLKGKLDWTGLTFGKYLQHLQKPQAVVCSSASECCSTEMQLPLGSDIRNSARSQGMGPGLCPGGNQQVTMDHNGKGESISNTVGSIFIYSPGMVVLGSNSKERKEETEEISEEIPLMSVPQQESSLHPQDDSMGVGMQEEFGKELSFPVPATSK
ncbi:uncharacterized protein [Salminus brasiliensis]|uniref:uncharacterized protein isoform X2 n=1 Tax=Salminus brasiliensis TaxID=930266 RepID=UPI003B83090A